MGTELDYPVGRLLAGSADDLARAHARFDEQRIDESRLCAGHSGYSMRRTRPAGRSEVTGPGTFACKARRKLSFHPHAAGERGWWIERQDQPESLPIEVSVRNVWTTVRNIVLRSGSPHNYLRMVEHIVALRLGLGLDDVCIGADAADPPLFNRGSLDLIEAIDRAGVVETDEPASFVTVREPVSIGGDRGDFLTLLPAEPGNPRLRIDCAIDFKSAIGRQRIRIDLTPETFRYGAQARTNATGAQMLFVKTIGRLFADTRNLGYTFENILIHGRKRYLNEPRLLHGKRSLEAVWHRAVLDLVAALALVDRGRFVGTVVSYRAGHALDVRLVTLLYRFGLLEELRISGENL